MIYLRSDIDTSGRIYGRFTKTYIPSQDGEYLKPRGREIFPNLLRWLSLKYLLPGEKDKFKISDTNICEIFVDHQDDSRFLVSEIMEQDEEIIVNRAVKAKYLELSMCPIIVESDWVKLARRLEQLYKDPIQQKELEKKYMKPNHFNDLLPILHRIKSPESQLDILCDFFDAYPDYKRDVWKLNPKFQPWFDTLGIEKIRRAGFIKEKIAKSYWNQKKHRLFLLLCHDLRRGTKLDAKDDGNSGRSLIMKLRRKISDYLGMPLITYDEFLRIIRDYYIVYTTDKITLTDIIT